MNIWTRLFSLLLSLLLQGNLSLAEGSGITGPDEPVGVLTYEEYLDRYDKAIVSVQVFSRNEEEKDVLMATCSGFIYDEKGYLLTSSSALLPFFGYDGRLNPEVNIKVMIYGETEFRDARLIHILERPDLAVLKVGEKDELFHVIDLTTKKDKQVGSDVFALGYPLREGKKIGLAPGYITEYGVRNLSEDLFPHRLITSSCVFPLSYSGSPVFDREGYFAGIVTALTEREFSDISGYFYNAEEVVNVLKLLDTKKSESRVSFGAHFMSEEDFLPLRKIYGFPEGVYVTEVIRDGSAYTAKVKAGDIILSVNGRGTVTPEALNEMLVAARRGAEWRIRVYHTEDNRTEDLVLYLQSDRAGKYSAR